MARSKAKTLDLSSALLRQGKTALATLPGSSAVIPLPLSEMPMVLTLDELHPNPDNPRTSRNPKYDDIKASIRTRGLDTVPKVTRDPQASDPGYIFSDGGNTRYEVLHELWQETGEERYYRVPCLFKPWPGRLSCVIGHLAENEVRGSLSFIEKALGIKTARAIYEEQLAKKVTLRELSALLTAEGYPVHNSSISRMEDTVKYLYPYMPALLESGLGAPQIRQLLALRSEAEKTWQEHSFAVEVAQPFEVVFGKVCRHFDDPEVYSLDMFRDELIGELLKALPHPSLNYDRWLLELDPKEQNRRKHFGDPTSLAEEISPPAILINAHNQDDNAADQPAPFSAPRIETQLDLYDAPPVLSGELPDKHASEKLKTAELSPAKSDETINQPSVVTADSSLAVAEKSDVADAEGIAGPLDAIWAIPAILDDIEHLQGMAFCLAFELAEMAGCEAEIKADKSGQHAAGYGLADLYLVTEQINAPSRFTLMLLTLADINNTVNDGCGLNEALIGSNNPASEPLLDDIHTMKLMRLIRVMRRLRQLQRDLPVTEETA